MRVSTDIVLRYCPPLDRFVRVRVFTETEVAHLLARARFEGRQGYVRFVLSLCLPEYASGLLRDCLDRFEHRRDLEAAETALYQVCVDLNPGLEISRVAIPVTPAPATEDLYLLEGGEEPSARETDSRKYLELEVLLRRRVVGQEDALSRVARTLRRAAAGLRDPSRPVGSFFLLGQTGVGKTELAKALADALFEGEDRLVRIDCSEYSQPHEYAKLIGAPPGYIGHQDGGQLTDPVRAKGRCVVLFDEIEKAHPKVHQLLLQVLDEGVLTDNKGRKASFRDAVVAMTSNVGSREVEELGRRVGFGGEPEARDVESTSLRALRDCFPPEFVNRIDEVVVFRPLGREECLQICELLLAEVAGYLAPRGLTVEFDGEVKEHLVDTGTDARYGARPLRRTIQRKVLDPLAERLLSGDFREGRCLRAHRAGESVWFEAA